MQGLVNVIVYIDDLLLYSKTHQEHRQQLELLFNRLRNTNFKANLPKCKFGADNVSYLEFRLTPDGILPGADKLKAVTDSKPPASVDEVRQFVGLLQVSCQKICSNWQPFSQTHIKGDSLERWTTATRLLGSNSSLKQALCSEPVVDYLLYSLTVDASMGYEKTPGGLGAILCQTEEKD